MTADPPDPIEAVPDPETIRVMLADAIRRRELLRSLLRTAVRKANYAAHLEAKGDTPGHVKKTAALITALFVGAEFVFLRDVDAAKAAAWLNAVRRDARPVDLPAGADAFTPGEAAALLGVTRKAVGKASASAGWPRPAGARPAVSHGPAVEVLALATARGVGPQQCNHYVRAAKGFTRWLTRTRRIGADPLETMTLLERRRRRAARPAGVVGQRPPPVARRHPGKPPGVPRVDRPGPLRTVPRGRRDRVPGERLGEPHPGRLRLAAAPTVTTAARFDQEPQDEGATAPGRRGRGTAGFLAGRAAAPGLGRNVAGEGGAEMLRLDLEAAGIPYAVEGPDGPEYADFHALRHSYLTLGGRAGIDLRTLQELAGHSTPTLTARYMHVRLRDAAGAVEKLPPLVPDAGPNAASASLPLRMTGTEGANGVSTGAVPGAVPGDIGPHRSAPERHVRRQPPLLPAARAVRSSIRRTKPCNSRTSGGGGCQAGGCSRAA